MVPASDKCKPKFIVGNGDGMLQTDLDDREHQECNEAFEMDDEEEPKGHDESEEAEQQDGSEDGSTGMMDVQVGEWISLYICGV